MPPLSERAKYREQLRKVRKTGEPLLVNDVRDLLNPALIGEFLGRRWKHSQNQVAEIFSITNPELGTTVELHFTKKFLLPDFSLRIDPGRNVGATSGFDLPIQSMELSSGTGGNKSIKITSGDLTLNVDTSDLYVMLFRNGLPIAHADLRQQLGFLPADGRKRLAK